MSNILIVEDETLIRQGLVKIAQSLNENLKILETSKAAEALSFAKTNLIDAFFLDIQLEDYSGFELAKQIREIETYKFTPIVFITAIYLKELEAFRNIHCYDYIIKPFSKTEIQLVFKNILTYGIPKSKDEDNIKLTQKGITYIYKKSEIIYIEYNMRKLYLKTIKEKAKISNYSLLQMDEQLSNEFIRCHKSFIINSQYINKIDWQKNMIYLDRECSPIPIGRKYKSMVKELII